MSAPNIKAVSDCLVGTGSGGGSSGGSGSAVMEEMRLNPDTAQTFAITSDASNVAWIVKDDSVDGNGDGDANLFNYTVYLKVSNNGNPFIIHNPLVQIADVSSGHSPVYVPANSLIFTTSNSSGVSNARVAMKRPVSWLDVMQGGTSYNWEIWIRRVAVSEA